MFLLKNIKVLSNLGLMKNKFEDFYEIIVYFLNILDKYCICINNRILLIDNL